MLLKRKRSESELSFSSCSAFSSPPRPADQHMSVDMDMVTSPTFGFQPSRNPAHLHSRTMKRFRDSRPSDDEVHRKLLHGLGAQPRGSSGSCEIPAERTLNILYSAQRHQQHPDIQQQSPAVTTAPAPPRPSGGAVLSGSFSRMQAAEQQQQSLHSFWNLPASSAPSNVAPAIISTPSLSAPIDTPSNCDDCGQSLAGGADSMDVDGGAQTNCGACGKHVCSHCSITNLGEQRRCLVCAGSTAWIGGQGWTNPSVGVY
jgi:hypothetical protein